MSFIPTSKVPLVRLKSLADNWLNPEKSVSGGCRLRVNRRDDEQNRPVSWPLVEHSLFAVGAGLKPALTGMDQRLCPDNSVAQKILRLKRGFPHKTPGLS